MIFVSLKSILSSPVPWKALVPIYVNVLANWLLVALPVGAAGVSLGAGFSCVKVFRAVVFLKALSLILVTVLGNLTVVSFSAPLKVELLIVVKAVVDKSRAVKPELVKVAFTSLFALSALPRVLSVFGTFNAVKLVVLAKAPCPIVVKAVFDKSRAVMAELKKVLVPIEVICAGNFTSVKLAAFSNVPPLITVTLVALKSIVVKPEPAKAEPLIVVTLLGISIVFKLVVFWKALPLIVVNPLGSLTLLKLVQPWNRLLGKLVTWVADKSMVVREVVAVELLLDTFPNTLFPKLVKLFGTFTSVKLEQLWKALSPIVSNFVA